MLHAVRRWITTHATNAGLALAPRLSVRGVRRLERALARFGPRCPRVAAQIADNMRAIGLYSPVVHRAHFEHIAAHLAAGLHSLRHDHPTAAQRAAIGRLVDETIDVEDSVRDIARRSDRRGMVIMGPHIANFMFNLPRLHREIPLTIYMRWSKNPARHVAKLRWCRSHAMDWLIEPPPAPGQGSRLLSMVAALRGGRTMFITPDMPRKREDGTPVRFFGREVYFPAGAAVLAIRAGAPLYMLTARVRDGRQWLALEGPVYDGGATDGGGVRATVQRLLQWYATRFERFVREEPALWYSWGDKRWTRVFQGDQAYVRGPATGATADSSVAGAPAAQGS